MTQVQTETVFQTQCGATYWLREIDADEAEAYGCDGSTHMVIGRTGYMIGKVTPITGRVVRVPGWPSRRGTLAWFTQWGAPETGEPFKGWVGE